MTTIIQQPATTVVQQQPAVLVQQPIVQPVVAAQPTVVVAAQPTGNCPSCRVIDLFVGGEWEFKITLFDVLIFFFVLFWFKLSVWPLIIHFPKHVNHYTQEHI